MYIKYLFVIYRMWMRIGSVKYYFESLENFQAY